jgi:uridylate kinase
MAPVYKRILLKLSGEAFQENDSFGISPHNLLHISTEIARVSAMGVQVGLVVGAGNFVRGADFCKAEIDRVTADQMGMLATILNGLALRDALDRRSIPVKVMSAFAMPGIVDFYSRRSAIDALQQGYVVIFVGGTGNPLVTTDSAAALRGIEVNADVLIKATKVDGVFSEDPFKNPQAEYYPKLTYKEVLERHLGVMDLNAIILCQEHKLPVQILNMHKPDVLQHALIGKAVGTLVS